MADGQVRIVVEDNAKQSARNFDKLDKELKDVSSDAEKASKSFISLKTAIGAVGVAVAARALSGVVRQVINIASEAEETANKFAVTFSSIREEADLTAQRIASSFGLASDETQKLLADTGDLLTGFGFTQEQALATSTAVNELAVDLASFTNIEGGAARASAALTSALLGEREAIKSLGIAILEADIDQLAEDKGIVGELTRQQKALLTLELAISQSQNAIGDFARSQDSYANQVRIFEASLRDVSAVLGRELLPVATEVVGELNDLFTDDATIEGLATFARGIGAIGTAAISSASAIGSLSNAIDNLLDLASDFLFGDEFAKAADDVRELNKLQEKLNSQIAKLIRGESTGSVFVNLKADYEALSKKVEQDDLGRKLNSSLEIASSKLFEINEITTEAIDNLSSGLSVALTTPFKEGESAAQRFGNVALSVLQQVAQTIITKQLTGFFTSLIGGSSFAGNNAGTAASAGVSVGDLAGAFAKGGVFSGGVQAFADGGAFTNSVVSKPTLFPMANGGTGLMGEAGAEAIMPLTRRNGKLGVEAGNVSPTVNVFNQSGAEIETVARPDNEVDVFVRRFNSALASERSQSAFGAALGRQNNDGVQAV